jgi:hypothetical protein
MKKNTHKTGTMIELLKVIAKSGAHIRVSCGGPVTSDATGYVAWIDGELLALSNQDRSSIHTYVDIKKIFSIVGG